ncbi:MAG TPA: endolytic transglycosylase MltG [Noviherbaspirillum sp.]|nr:endolytic transglycosylase MltG [Noviherbaspirillum sp.]
MRKLFVYLFLLGLVAAVIFAVWAYRPLVPSNGTPIEFEVRAGSSVRSTMRQMVAGGVPVNPWMMEALARLSGKSSRLKAGFYEVTPGTSPLALIDKLARGDYVTATVTIIEGWTFRQMRAAIAAQPALRHHTSKLSDSELLAKIGSEFKHPEGLFFPDTYRFAKGTSDLQVFRQAHALMQRRLNEVWERRDPSLPYKSPYDVLIMASIIEKETGQSDERNLVAAVFVNRLRLGMLLQTDPTVIYGMGDRFDGNIRKRDLTTDTPYNTYTRAGLPPTPIALPGAASLLAAVTPAESNALYFVSRGDGTSQFSTNLADHNRAVNKYQRSRR